ncbi:DUF3578 domain-containing protein [Haloterrigena salifodinae]|uniref:DUF3578 domain-containing protein n=1 Tax=Haloterrigena salifodinae TaxID=2675099 RepID=A0A8T8E0D5_9EURY|nr:DUF3578 domain-containing protein [Haloterrigena salifodinae]QRV14896.1 DUF3578 domain-containing protein [Haloterrigena salifodinae]
MSSSARGFSGLFRRVLSEYPVDQIGQGITDHETRTDIEERIPDKIRQILDDENLAVKASAGKGRWTSIPWIAILDPRETNNIQEGIYAVYLFEPQEDRVTLTLNQGVTEIKNDLGTREARHHLKETARSVREKFDPTGFSAGQLEFPHASSRNSLYGPGTIFYKRYELGEIPDDEQIIQDLKTLVDTYRKYVSDEGILSEDPDPEPDSYDGISDATESIRSKLDQTGHENWLDSHFIRSILPQWTSALRGFGPNTQPTPEEVFVFDQIEALFEQIESDLEDLQSNLRTGSVGSLSPTETLFVVLTRDLQSKLDLTVNMNHVKFLNLRGNEFDLAKEEEDDSEEATVDNAEEIPISEYFENQREEITVWRFTSHGDDYPTIYQHGAIQFTDSQKDDFDKIDRGDIIVFYVTQETKNSNLRSPGKGLIGCGIVSNKRTKNESWWWNEFYGDADYRNIVEFDELYVTGDINEINLETSIDEKSDSTIEAEIEAIKQNRIRHEILNERSQELRESDFPVVSVLVDLHVENDENKELVEWILDELSTRVTQIEPDRDRDEIDELPDEEPPNRAEEIASQLTSTGQVIFHGPPGTGKTHTARKFSRWWLNDQLEQPTADQLRVVTFHPSFNYEDFLEGLTAKQDETGTVTYGIENGIFKQICRDAERAYRDADDPSKADPYILIIDEINRGNLAKIFGETITQLERNKRLGASEEVIVELAHSGDEFGIPPNLHVIGTMNTADRSIALVDAALRRRFSFFSFPPDYDVFAEEYDFGSSGLDEFLDDSPRFHQLLENSIAALQVVNANILDSGELGKGKRIGHSYLLGLNSAKDVRDAWYYNILPLLEEYYFEELGRLQASVFETEDCDLFDVQNRKIADFDVETLDQELGRLLERTDQSYSFPS